MSYHSQFLTLILLLFFIVFTARICFNKSSQAKDAHCSHFTRPCIYNLLGTFSGAGRFPFWCRFRDSMIPDVLTFRLALIKEWLWAAFYFWGQSDHYEYSSTSPIWRCSLTSENNMYFHGKLNLADDIRKTLHLKPQPTRYGTGMEALLVKKNSGIDVSVWNLVRASSSFVRASDISFFTCRFWHPSSPSFGTA